VVLYRTNEGIDQIALVQTLGSLDWYPTYFSALLSLWYWSVINIGYLHEEQRKLCILSYNKNLEW